MNALGSHYIILNIKMKKKYDWVPFRYTFVFRDLMYLAQMAQQY